MPVDACAPYDDSNVFARILRGELPHQTIFSDPWALAFADVAPLAPVHVLVIPTGRYVSLADFTIHASDQEIVGFWRAVGSVTHDLKLTRDGFRLVTNAGRDAGQEVPHMHVHLFAGGPLGPMLARL